MVGQFDRGAEACKRLAAVGCEVSLFIGADPAQIEAAATIAPVIELHTGRYADAETAEEQAAELEVIKQGVKLA